MRHIAQIFTKTLVLFFLLSFFVLSVSAQSALRLVLPIVSTVCFNGIDDDSDGFIDYPDDTDCVDQNDQSEHHLTATCAVSATTVTLGQSTTWTVTPLGGSTSYTYSWSGFQITGDTQNVVVTYASVGNKTASVTVTSGVDTLTVNCSDTVSVTFADSIPEPTPVSGGGSNGSSGGGPPVELPPIPDIDVPSQLDSAPEEALIVQSPIELEYRETPTQSRRYNSTSQLNLREIPSEVVLVPDTTKTEQRLEPLHREKYLRNKFSIIFPFYICVSIVFLYFLFQSKIFSFLRKKRLK